MYGEHHALPPPPNQLTGMRHRLTPKGAPSLSKNTISIRRKYVVPDSLFIHRHHSFA